MGKIIPADNPTSREVKGGLNKINLFLLLDVAQVTLNKQFLMNKNKD